MGDPGPSRSSPLLKLNVRGMVVMEEYRIGCVYRCVRRGEREKVRKRGWLRRFSKPDGP